MYTPFELFGVECGKGWYPLVKKAIATVACYNGINRPDPYRGPIEFTQIKEKFGGLQLYVNYGIYDLYEKLDEIENESYFICERCGSKENVTTEETYGWIYTLCDKCREKEIERFNKLCKG